MIFRPYNLYQMLCLEVLLARRVEFQWIEDSHAVCPPAEIVTLHDIYMCVCVCTCTSFMRYMYMYIYLSTPCQHSPHF